MANISKSLLKEEASQANLGNRGRTKRLSKCVATMSTRPALSFPRMFSEPADLEGFYRFLGNPSVTAEEILEPHIRNTAQRAQECPGGSVIVAHDTSEFRFSGEKREGLGRLSIGKDQGFFGHFSLVLSDSKLRQPLGIASCRHLVRGPQEKRPSGRLRKENPNRESKVWLDGILAVEDELGPGINATHVADRAADDYGDLSELKKRDISFVFRSRANRPIKESSARLHDHFREEHGTFFRRVPIARRQRVRSPRRRKRYPERDQREAKLAYLAKAVTLKRPHSARLTDPKILEINVIRIHEVDTPEGAEPIEWVLLSNKPIESQTDIEEVVDAYVARWRIEEFFKAIKTGCQFEKRQLESFSTIKKALAMFVPIAWQLLLIKTLARESGDSPHYHGITGTQLELLSGLTGLDLSPEATMEDVLKAIARLGGHIKQNGPPGWQVLGRGFEELVVAERGWRLALNMREKK